MAVIYLLIYIPKLKNIAFEVGLALKSQQREKSMLVYFVLTGNSIKKILLPA